MSEKEPEWEVGIAPFYPFVMSMALPIAAQFIFPGTRYPYFDKVNDKLNLPNPPDAITNYVNGATFWRFLFGSISCTIGYQFISKSMDEMSDDDENVTLATNGVWGLTRNPIYLGSIFIQLGSSLIADNGITAASIIPYFLWLQFIVLPIEEAGLIKYFGDAYKDYMKKTKRWIIF